MTRINYCFTILVIFQTSIETCKGQGSYQPMLDTSKQWTVLEHFFMPGEDSYSETYANRLRGDTTISDLKYFFLEECRNDSLFSVWKRTGYLLREDTEEEKVYIFNQTTESLLYDFSVEPGDMLELGESFHVDSIRYINIAGKLRKVIYLESCYNEPLEMIEGIGTFQSLVEPYWWCSVGVGSSRELLCFSQNDEVLIQNNANCFVSRYVNSIIPSVFNRCMIYPNPAKDFFWIVLENTVGEPSFILRDINGKIVLQRELEIGENRIDAAQLVPGFYLFSFQENHIEVFNRVLIIN